MNLRDDPLISLTLELWTQLQDARRKLAAMGQYPTKLLNAGRLERSLRQLDWDLLCEEEDRIHKDWHDTQKDAQDIGMQ